jgi:hypothetical protein
MLRYNHPKLCAEVAAVAPYLAEGLLQAGRGPACPAAAHCSSSSLEDSSAPCRTRNARGKAWFPTTDTPAEHCAASLEGPQPRRCATHGKGAAPQCHAAPRWRCWPAHGCQMCPEWRCWVTDATTARMNLAGAAVRP